MLIRTRRRLFKDIYRSTTSSPPSRLSCPASFPLLILPPTPSPSIHPPLFLPHPSLSPVLPHSFYLPTHPYPYRSPRMEWGVQGWNTFLHSELPWLSFDRETGLPIKGTVVKSCWMGSEVQPTEKFWALYCRSFSAFWRLKTGLSFPSFLLSLVSPFPSR